MRNSLQSIIFRWMIWGFDSRIFCFFLCCFSFLPFCLSLPPFNKTLNSYIKQKAYDLIWSMMIEIKEFLPFYPLIEIEASSSKSANDYRFITIWLILYKGRSAISLIIWNPLSFASHFDDTVAIQLAVMHSMQLKQRYQRQILPAMWVLNHIKLLA